MATICLLLALCAVFWVTQTHAFLSSKISLKSFSSTLRHTVRSSTLRAVSTIEPTQEFAHIKDNKLLWKEEGYETWKFAYNNEEFNVNFVDCGKETDRDKPPLLLIHGFGASVFHWRYNIPELAKDYHVFAIDMLGFGLSEKKVMDYNAELWRDQTIAFIKEVIQPRSNKVPCVVAGNSLGGFTALYSAAAEGNDFKDLIKGCILINAAGRFKKNHTELKEQNPFIKSLQEAFQRFVIGLSFIYTKQPARIEQVLKQVYPVDPSNVNAELVESIRFPALDPNAAEVFYRVIKKNGNGPPVFVDDLLIKLKVPLLLLWGSQDPWIRPQAADTIQELFPKALRTDVNGGHCPHDEVPADVNNAIKEFMTTVYAS